MRCCIWVGVVKSAVQSQCRMTAQQKLSCSRVLISFQVSSISEMDQRNVSLNLVSNSLFFPETILFFFWLKAQAGISAPAILHMIIKPVNLCCYSDIAYYHGFDVEPYCTI